MGAITISLSEFCDGCIIGCGGVVAVLVALLAVLTMSRHVSCHVSVGGCFPISTLLLVIRMVGILRPLPGDEVVGLTLWPILVMPELGPKISLYTP